MLERSRRVLDHLRRPSRADVPTRSPSVDKSVRAKRLSNESSSHPTPSKMMTSINEAAIEPSVVRTVHQRKIGSTTVLCLGMWLNGK